VWLPYNTERSGHHCLPVGPQRSQVQVVDIAPVRSLAWLEVLDDGVAGTVEVLGSVLSRPGSMRSRRLQSWTGVLARIF
jgi:hypothetical protein